MGKEQIIGPINIKNMLEIGKKTNLMDMEQNIDLKKDIMKASLKNLKSTEKVSCTINLEEKRMKDSSKMIKYMDMEYFIGFQA